jgi:3-phenylpropionate/cinnamic acid dioxygenase small subunit
LTIGLLAAFASAGWAWAQGRNARGLTGADYAEIQQLYARYAQGTDLVNAQMWLDVFTADATFNPAANGPNGGTPFVGKQAITKWRMDNFAARKSDRQYRHWVSSFVIEPTDDGNAKGRVYWLAFDPTVDPAAIADTGVYADVYVRTGAGWRIKQRFAHSDPQPAPNRPAL